MGTWSQERLIVSDGPTRKARMRAHAAIDPLWRSGEMSRAGVYRWLAGELGLSSAECHIHLFNAEECARVVQAAAERRST